MKRVKSKIKRVPKRALYDKEGIYKILDKEVLCHVGIIHQGHPVVIPTLYGRRDDKIYIHGASISRLINEVESGMEISISVANVYGLVLARSLFHHSANYESVVLFGKGKLVSDSEKKEALKIISDHIINGRWEEARLPNKKELKATKVIEIEISEASAKVRTGPPIDDKNDYNLNVWAGILPIEKRFGEPVPDDKMMEQIAIPKSIKKLIYENHDK
jgi:nitroimidazol reductase NimA-like FMN-containing flavoprotein (pyridoxamine 5'-phosphate oxidase superfamily)